MKELHFTQEFQKFITASKTGKRVTASGKKITDGVLRNYKFTLLLVEQYQQKHTLDLRIALLNKASLRTIQQEKNYWQRFYKNFTKFLYTDKKCHDNYVGSIFKNIKTFFNYLLIDKAYPVGQYHKMFKTPKNNFSPVVLTPQQLNFLITNKEFYNGLTQSLKKICDLFIVGCTVGLRVGDLMKLKKSNLVTSNGETYLKVYTQKTGTEIIIPLPAYAIDILNKYNKSKNGLLLPQISKVNLNKYIKQLAEKANWTDPLPKNNSKQGKIIEQKKTNGEVFRFCDHITSHTMRRTAITTLLILGVPEMVVRKLSGHAAGSKEFYKYVVIANDYTNNQLKQAHEKLFNFQNQNGAILAQEN